MSSQSKVLERIRKCLNLANDDGAMAGEIKSALKFAKRLMNQHGVTIEEVEAGEGVVSNEDIAAAVALTSYVRQAMPGMSKSRTAWEIDVLNAICDLIGTVRWYGGGAMYVNDKPYGPERLRKERRLVWAPTIYGPAEDVSDAITMIKEWTAVVAACAWAKYKAVIRGEGRSYCEGFAGQMLDNVRDMIRADRAEAAKLTPGQPLAALPVATDSKYAIVLGERRSALAVQGTMRIALEKKKEASRWLQHDQGINLVGAGAVGSGTRHHSGAYGAGRRDGVGATPSHSRKPKLGAG